MLIAVLLAAAGFVTAAIAMSAMDQSVDRTLQASAARMAETVQSSSESENVSEDGTTGGEDGATGGQAAPPVGTVGGETDERPPEASDTFFLVLDQNGNVIANPQRVGLAGLPNPDAVNAALTSVSGEDWRTVDVGGVHVRLLTQRLSSDEAGLSYLLQSGYVLTLHDEQTAQMLMTIFGVSLVGLAGAGVITLIVTRRALAPIREAFTAERRFVAAASHELRTPVAVIRASAEILEREQLVEADGRRYVTDIEAEADRLGRLIGDLLALASAQAGAITIEPRTIEMRGFVEALGERVRSMASGRGVTVKVVQDGSDVDGDRELVVSADPDRMTQLLLIFLDNAIAHSPEDGLVQLVVRPLMESGKAAVSVDVVDQGPGVPHEERSRIFEPFARIYGRRRETGNTGLGLAIAQILASRQSATIHVDDAQGGGAVFSVSLPRLASTAATA